MQFIKIMLQLQIQIKSYKQDKKGNIILGGEKKGVPLSDVWEIPFLNPKAKERVGYPTQKPILLLQQIIKIATDENDLVLDPFCGSGTTCVASKLLNRNYIGIDKSKLLLQNRNKLIEACKKIDFSCGNYMGFSFTCRMTS